jgi:hypothetical protein
MNAFIKNLSVDSRHWMPLVGIWNVPAYLEVGGLCKSLWDGIVFVSSFTAVRVCSSWFVKSAYSVWHTS